MALKGVGYYDAVVTVCFGLISLIGSIIVLFSYLIARRGAKSTPKTAFLILQLAVSDFLWFLCSIIICIYLLSKDSKVPKELCFILSPAIAYTRTASLIWTCVISYNVLMSVRKRKWILKNDEKEERYRIYYYGIIFIFAAPATILCIIKQQSGNELLGCDAEYEPLQDWAEIVFTQLLQLFAGFIFNVAVYLIVRKRMSKISFPQSVRKKRKRIMYHYIIVCIFCWTPTIIGYIFEILGLHSDVLEIIARSCLYASGFLNFLVFGMQDPHLKRSFLLLLFYFGCICCIPNSFISRTETTKSGGYIYSSVPLKVSDIEKSVMFEESTVSKNADVMKDKKDIYKRHKLSDEERRALYEVRPDLDLSKPLLPNQSAPPSRATIQNTSDNKKSANKSASISYSIIDRGVVTSKSIESNPLHQKSKSVDIVDIFDDPFSNKAGAPSNKDQTDSRISLSQASSFESMSRNAPTTFLQTLQQVWSSATSYQPIDQTGPSNPQREDFHATTQPDNSTDIPANAVRNYSTDSYFSHLLELKNVQNQGSSVQSSADVACSWSSPLESNYTNVRRSSLKGDNFMSSSEESKEHQEDEDDLSSEDEIDEEDELLNAPIIM